MEMKTGKWYGPFKWGHRPTPPVGMRLVIEKNPEGKTIYSVTPLDSGENGFISRNHPEPDQRR